MVTHEELKRLEADIFYHQLRLKSMFAKVERVEPLSDEFDELHKSIVQEKELIDHLDTERSRKGMEFVGIKTKW